MTKAVTSSRSKNAAAEVGHRPNDDGVSRPILVAGSGRSGTTWISDVLAASVGCGSVFEPLHTTRVAEVPGSNQDCSFPGTYLRPDEEAAEWESFFERVFLGTIENRWTRQDWRSKPTRYGASLLPDSITLRLARRRYRGEAARASRRVIKIIRGNLLLGWLRRRFAPATVLIIRHPCAVVASRLRHRWPESLDGISGQPKLIADHLAAFHDTIASADDPVRRMTVLWCVENLTAIRAIGGDPHAWVGSYESFVDAPREQFSRLRDRLGLGASERANRVAARWTSNPSRKTLRQRRNWDGGLSTGEVDRVLDTCRRFGMGLYGRAWGPADLTRRADSDQPHGMTNR